MPLEAAPTVPPAAAAVRVAGEIDLSNAQQISDDVAAALAAGATWIGIDLADVTFMSSSGLSALVAARQACQAAQARLTLKSPSTQTLRILTLTGMLPLFDIPGPDAP
jgi:anti-sigma B factor antagonist